MKFKFGNLFKESNIERKEIIKMKKDLEEQDCFVEASNDERMTTNLTTDEADLTRISKFARLTKKFNPQHKAYRVTRRTPFAGSLCILIKARVNKTVKNLTSYRLNVLTTSNNVTPHSPFTTHYSRKRCAFTLAEVLITLGIIGVVAAMTLPTLVQKQQEKVAITKLKKAYSILSQAYYSAISEYGNSSEWEHAEWEHGESRSSDGAIEIANKLKPHFKVTKDCGINRGCFPAVIYKKIDGGDWYDIYNTDLVYKIKLSDGTIMGFESNGNTKCQNGLYCAKVFVDINGSDGPNQAAYDMFSFYLEKGRVMPFGYQGDPLKTSIGEEYTAWALINENMDYKRCPEKIGWDKAKSCNE